ncbi:MAG TPA: hypothetical protein VKY65_16635 [Alphaproteobacteria bacterium]|nr:hypothetical protein [Alphaproteobacteria bacterium]
MQSLTLEQLRAATRAGGIASVTLKGEGGAFLVAVATRGGEDGVLVTTRGHEPRRFADLRKAMLLLREMGIGTAQIDATRWNPDVAAGGARRPDRAAAMRRAHAAAAHDRWFRAQVEAGLREAADSATATVPHAKAMAEAQAAIDHAAAKARGRRAR